MLYPAQYQQVKGRILFLACALLWGGCIAPAIASEKPQRIVSLNLCTDQLLMMLVDANRIVGVSYLARRRSSSAMAAHAQSLPITYGGAEDVIMLQADLILAGTYSTRATVHMLKKLKHNVIVVAPARNFTDVLKNIRLIAKAVGEVRKGEQLIGQLQLALNKTPLNGVVQTTSKPNPVAALVYSRGYTSGTGTLANQILLEGGFYNLAQKLGFAGSAKVSMESLLVEQPDAIVLGRKDFGGDDLAHEIFHHPALEKILNSTPSMTLADKYWVCGTPYILKAVQRVKEFRRSLQANLPANKSGGSQ